MLIWTIKLPPSIVNYEQESENENTDLQWNSKKKYEVNEIQGALYLLGKSRKKNGHLLTWMDTHWVGNSCWKQEGKGRALVWVGRSHKWASINSHFMSISKTTDTSLSDLYLLSAGRHSCTGFQRASWILEGISHGWSGTVPGCLRFNSVMDHLWKGFRGLTLKNDSGKNFRLMCDFFSRS